MKKTKLEIAFEKAYQISSTSTKKLPQDIMLKIYAYYKQATKGSILKPPAGNIETKNAFKLNAWFQLNQMPEEEAKQKYINLVNKYLK